MSEMSTRSEQEERHLAQGLWGAARGDAYLRRLANEMRAYAQRNETDVRPLHRSVESADSALR